MPISFVLAVAAALMAVSTFAMSSVADTSIFASGQYSEMACYHPYTGRLLELYSLQMDRLTASSTFEAQIQSRSKYVKRLSNSNGAIPSKPSAKAKCEDRITNRLQEGAQEWNKALLDIMPGQIK
ncbi:uncharacterized protein F5891DRAFT_984160 [Suillus fuscotomentosus]|uniref:Uncharacterized protein n=1 Tax=Suillus fuscotomentosus TaxID=1912939 RepID=A0AAD4HGC4_9AGAM|nr:uncharacterized protein F5891DRAFT_984160 [Suillus fuscotomentosus]KAG1895543.1 hypothetical protein F5891DRAFT_984160 [Suillus fuscotomentosus]